VIKGTRTLLPWTAGPGRIAENVDPEHLLVEDSKDRSLATRFISLFNTVCVVACSRTMCLAPTADPLRSLLPACSPWMFLNVEEEKGAKFLHEVH